MDRIKKEAAIRRAAAAERVRLRTIEHALPAFLTTVISQKKAEAELAKQREAEKAARSYDSLFSGEVDEEEAEEAPKKSVRELEEDFM